MGLRVPLTCNQAVWLLKTQPRGLFMTNASVAQGIEQFVLSITSHVLSEGQGHNSQKADHLQVELAWHLQDDRSWCLYLAVVENGKTRTMDTEFQTEEREKSEQAKRLSKLLLDKYNQLIG
jgi:hypothetical protein